jgi:hypothetical protein
MNFGSAASWAGDPGGPLSTNAFRSSVLRFINGAIALHSARSAAVVSLPAAAVDDADEEVGFAEVAVGRMIAVIPTTSAALASNIAVTKPTVINSPRLRGGGDDGCGGWGYPPGGMCDPDGGGMPEGAT